MGQGSGKKSRSTESSCFLLMFIFSITVFIQPIRDEQDLQKDVLSVKCMGKLFPCDCTSTPIINEPQYDPFGHVGRYSGK